MKIDSRSHNLNGWHRLLAAAALQAVHKIESTNFSAALVRTVDLAARPVSLVQLLHYPGELVQFRVDQKVVVVLAGLLFASLLCTSSLTVRLLLVCLLLG